METLHSGEHLAIVTEMTKHSGYIICLLQYNTLPLTQDMSINDVIY